ncbi:hypothetical protein K501DRAFT_336633 [Backusella circina FSU 941]|nr:hypothetical protein K501DRAFT_336633 [Backusella circina FSU 941]
MSDSSQNDSLFWIEQEPTTKSLEYFMPNDTPVKNPSALTINAESRKRKLRHKRSLSRLRTYSVGLLEEGFEYVSSRLDPSMLPRKSTDKFTSIPGDKFLQEKTSDIIDLMQYCEDIKSGRKTAETTTNSTETTDANNSDTNDVVEEYKKEAEKSFNQFSNDVTKKYISLSASLQTSYQTYSYFPDHSQNGSAQQQL